MLRPYDSPWHIWSNMFEGPTTLQAAVRKAGFAAFEFDPHGPNVGILTTHAGERKHVFNGLRLCEQQSWIDRTRARTVEQWITERINLIDDHEPPSLIHYDLHAGNIRIHQNTSGAWTLRALLDFELARGWLPEYDLAMLSWYLRSADETWWSAFLHGYGHTGPAVWERLRLFEMIKALGAMAYSGRDAAWGRWCRAKLTALIAGGV